MARKTASRKRKTAAKRPARRDRRFAPGRWLVRGLWSFALALVLMVAAYGVLTPPTTPYILSEGLRLRSVERIWVPYERIAPVVARSVVAAEDANFCLHWGVDMNALRDAISEGGQRGGSTVTQQTVKNLYLWQGRSWPRKALEGLMTPLAEVFWSKRRIVELYLNVAEFDEGVFGIEAAARHYFGVAANELTGRQAALLAAVLPNPRERSASKPSDAVQKRARAIEDGAATIDRDGRADCF